MNKKILHTLLSFIIVFAMSIGMHTVPATTAGAAEPTFLAPEAAHVPPGGIGKYIPGGRNVEAYRYTHSEGYPPFPDRTKWIGTLQGSWYAMGKQFGARSGDEVRCVSDIWWKQETGAYGKAETLKAIKLFEASIKALDPNLIDFLHGIADGAAPWLNQSVYASEATNYERVMAVNIYDEWYMNHPTIFPDGTSTYGGTEQPPPVRGIASCSAFAARGKATVGGVTISSHNRHTPMDPRNYQQAYMINPPRGNLAWVLSNCPQVAANQVVNEKGVSIILLFGGASNPASWGYDGGPYFAEGFGVPWFHLFLYVGTHADTAGQAIEILTRGTPEYRARTGRKSLLRAGGWIFLVSDKNTLAVVEVTADRYNVRYPGQLTGPDWTSTDYIVSTNQFFSASSYDKDNKLTSIPLTIFNVLGEDSDTRFWTLMWDMKQRFGRIDRYMTQHIMSGQYKNDKVTGERAECGELNGKIGLYGALFYANEGSGIGLSSGTNDGKIAVLDGDDISVFWTLGNPSDWAGAWDEYQFPGRYKNHGHGEK